MSGCDATLATREARERYFRENGFGEDGGYGARWVKFRMGPLRFAIPNTPARVRAVRYHDLHHVVTGYATDWTGEGEIGAWELASGCAGFVAAWVLNLYALAIGLVVAPRAMWRAFVRGRHTRNLYRTPWSEGLLDAPVRELRARLGLGAARAPEAGPADGALFVVTAAAALGLAAATLAALAAPALLAARALL
jgi:hypothetical protein